MTLTLFLFASFSSISFSSTYQTYAVFGDFQAKKTMPPNLQTENRYTLLYHNPKSKFNIENNVNISYTAILNLCKIM